MATIPVTVISSVGTALAYVAANAGGDQFANTGNEIPHIKNGGGAPINATFVGQTPCDQGTVHNTVVAIAAGVEAAIRGLKPSRYNDANRMCQITYSAVTSVTLYVEG